MLLEKLKQYFYSFISFLGLSKETYKNSNITEEKASGHYNETLDNECSNDNVEQNSSISFDCINWDLIHKVHKGDIVYVKMESEIILKEHISQYHQQRPFVVVEKDNKANKLYGYYTTHNVYNTLLHGGSKIVLNKDYHNLKYHSLVLVHRKVELPYENVIRKISHVSNDVLLQINDRARLEQKFINDEKKEDRIIETKDIIVFHKTMYLIYEHNSGFAYGFPIITASHRSKKSNNPDYYRYATFNQKLYFIDFDHPTTFSRTCSYEILDTISMTTVLDVLKQREHLKYLLKKDKQKQKQKKKKR